MSPAVLPAVLAAALTAAVAVSSAPPAVAEPIVGLWRTEPDGKDQTGDVRVAPCGKAFCGTIVAAQGPHGAPVVTPNVGRRVILGMEPLGGGVYRGEVFVPVLGADFPAEIAVKGGHMVLRACNAMGLCRRQVWRRLD